MTSNAIGYEDVVFNKLAYVLDRAGKLFIHDPRSQTVPILSLSVSSKSNLTYAFDLAYNDLFVVGGSMEGHMNVWDLRGSLNNYNSNLIGSYKMTEKAKILSVKSNKEKDNLIGFTFCCYPVSKKQQGYGVFDLTDVKYKMLEFDTEIKGSIAEGYQFRKLRFDWMENVIISGMCLKMALNFNSKLKGSLFEKKLKFIINEEIDNKFIESDVQDHIYNVSVHPNINDLFITASKSNIYYYAYDYNL